MRRQALALLCALLALLPGCAQRDAPGGEGEGYAVYFALPFDPEDPENRLAESALAAETRRIPEGAGVPEALVECLLSGPISPDLASPFPEGVRQVEPPSLEDGICRVSLSEEYGGLSGLELTLADYAITLTLCALPEVEGVTIQVEGDPFIRRDHTLLRESDVILSSGEDQPAYLSIDLYFLREGGGLGVEHRELLVPSGKSQAAVTMEALLAGPEGEGLSLPMPPGARLINLWVERDGTCYVNFDAPFLSGESPSPGEARLLLYAMVNTLCQLPGVDSVRLLVEGESPDSYGGVPTASPLEANYDLAAE